MSWRWIGRRALELLHDESIAEHGGAPGLRDAGMLDSALARPQQLAHYGGPDCAALAASYGFGLIKNHAFVDGNKRAAFLAVGMFLHLNGYRLTASQVDATRTMLALAGSELAEVQFADWIRDHSRAH
jgi:death on curing protein